MGAPRSIAWLLLAAALVGCRAGAKADTPRVERTPVYRSSGGAADPAPPPPSETPAAAARCEHAFVPLDRATHTYMDLRYDPPMPALCTPIRCEKCGVVRHECVRRRRVR